MKKTVKITQKTGGWFVGHIYNVERVEESYACYFFYGSDNQLVAGISKENYSYDFEPMTERTNA